MAPEVWKKEPYATSPDIWALGITMAVLLTGDPPFDADSPSELADVVCNQELDMEQAPWRYGVVGGEDTWGGGGGGGALTCPRVLIDGGAGFSRLLLLMRDCLSQAFIRGRS